MSSVAGNPLEGASEGEPADQLSADGVASPDSEYVVSVYGKDGGETGFDLPRPPRTSFAPWHHPVKQIVRDYQWADQVKRLMAEHRPEDHRHTLRYFTLPGADLLDVRMLAQALAESKTQIEYFGFDIGYGVTNDNQSETDIKDIYLETESGLRQAGRITDRAEILVDRLEDIALEGSQAANRLGQQDVFDVVNIDACDHLGYVPHGRSKSMFDALEALLAHQLRAIDPWLLFITSRVNPTLLGVPGTKLQSAIHKNLELHSDKFGEALAVCIGGSVQTLASDVAVNWSTQSLSFLKLFSVGLGKYLLQYYNGQLNLPATVELVSVFAYRVSSEEPDMLSLAFRITPAGIQVQPGSAGGASVIPSIEVENAIAVAEKATKLWNLDEAIAANDEVRRDAVQGTEHLLASANYDLAGWRTWLAGIPIRPMQLNDIA